MQTNPTVGFLGQMYKRLWTICAGRLKKRE